MPYGFLADVIVAAHLVYVSFVVFGQLAIFAGVIFKWSWIRNPWFRFLHLAMISIVALEAILDITCPLTTWEDSLRRLAHQPVEEGTFIGRLLHNLMFFDGPAWVFTTCYIGFALLVLGTFVLAPPRWRKRAIGYNAPPMIVNSD